MHYIVYNNWLFLYCISIESEWRISWEKLLIIVLIPCLTAWHVGLSWNYFNSSRLLKWPYLYDSFPFIWTRFYLKIPMWMKNSNLNGLSFFHSLKYSSVVIKMTIMFKKQFWYEEICLDSWSRSRLQMAICWSAILDTEKKSFPCLHRQVGFTK